MELDRGATARDVKRWYTGDHRKVTVAGSTEFDVRGGWLKLGSKNVKSCMPCKEMSLNPVGKREY